VFITVKPVGFEIGISRRNGLGTSAFVHEEQKRIKMLSAVRYPSSGWIEAMTLIVV
jgi:hypothetical protein